MCKNSEDSKYFLCYFLLLMIVVTAIARLSGLLWSKAERSACSPAVDAKATTKDNVYDEL